MKLEKERTSLLWLINKILPNLSKNVAWNKIKDFFLVCIKERYFNIRQDFFRFVFLLYSIYFVFTDSNALLSFSLQIQQELFLCAWGFAVICQLYWELIQLKNEHKDSIYGNFLEFFNQIFLGYFQQSPATVQMCKKNTEYTCCPRDIKARKVTRDPGSPREIRSGNMSRQKS